MDLFDRGTVEGITRRLLRVLEAVTADPRTRWTRIEVLEAVERQRVLSEWNATAREVPQATLPELFQAQVARTPEATAVVFEDMQLSYGELNGRANRLARELVLQGVGPEKRVALAMPRSAEMIVALLAISKAGAAYVPVDPEYPADRIRFIVQDSAPACVVTMVGAADAFPGVDVPVMAIDAPEVVERISGRPDTDLSDADRGGRLLPRNLAYVIFTSGSTGRPKGTGLEHGGLASLAATQLASLNLGPGCRVLLFASISFDTSVWEVCMALLSGAALVVPTSEERRPGAPLAEFVARQGVTHATLPPAVLSVLPDGGAAVGVDARRRW